jgi:hypothetical protein
MYDYVLSSKRRQQYSGACPCSKLGIASSGGNSLSNIQMSVNAHLVGRVRQEAEIGMGIFST